jgi:4-amino-4-deoxy-L-arabinose transferase-like glycosyltransferase
VRSASVSWKAFFFGSLDPGSFITVDKPPAALWVQALSVRILGFHTWSMLLPQVLAGVGSVLILHHLVRRWMGDAAAHLAALALATTPVAVLMFRYNNPDALLTFLCLAAAWALWSAVETGRTSRLVLAGALIGLAFDTKMLQALVVVPAFVLAYLVAGPPLPVPGLKRRLAQLAAGLAALVASAGWWIAAVAVWPASSRPYIGGTTDNSVLSLLFGYNGFGRVLGGDGNPTAGEPGGAGGGRYGGLPGPNRLFNSLVGGQVSWLIPLALIGLVAGAAVAFRRDGDTRERVGWLLWGGWALACMVVFSEAHGIFHPYYTVQLAPAIAALAGGGVVALWRLGTVHRAWRAALPAALVVSAAWALELLDRTPDYRPLLPPTIVAATVIAGVALLLAWAMRHRAFTMAAGAAIGVALLAGPAAYALSTVDINPTGATVLAGPVAAEVRRPQPTEAAVAGMVGYLKAHRGRASYLVAAFNAQMSAPFIITTGDPVLTIGGFKDLDPAPTLPQLREMVARGELRFALIGKYQGRNRRHKPGYHPVDLGLRDWIETRGRAVDPRAYGGPRKLGTLYDLAGVAAKP